MIELQVAPGQIALDVRVAGKSSSEPLMVEVIQPVYVGVSIDSGGTIVYTRSDQPFRYA
jgi:hypothetical protein